MTDWDANKYLAYMKDHELFESQGVMSFITEAKRQKRYFKIYRDYMASDPNPVTEGMMKKTDEARKRAIDTAVKIAEQEHELGWMLLEDGQKYVDMLMLKYKGDLTLCTDEERVLEEEIDKLDQQNRTQIIQARKKGKSEREAQVA